MSSVNNAPGGVNATDPRYATEVTGDNPSTHVDGGTDEASALDQEVKANQPYADWLKDKNSKDREEAQRALTDGVARNYGESYGADDDESKAAAASLKKGAKALGVTLTDKQLSAMSNAQSNDPAVQKFVADVSAGKTPDYKALFAGYQSNSAAQQVGGGTSADAATSAGSGATAATNLAATPDAGSTTSTSGTTTGASSTPTTSAATTTASSDTVGNTTANASDTASQQAIRNMLGGNLSAAGAEQSGGGRLGGGSWLTYVTMAMFNATKELQSQKKDELVQIKKYNGMLDALNTYTDSVLMPAQQELQDRISKNKGKNASSTEVTLYPAAGMTGIMTSMDTDDVDVDSSGKFHLRAAQGSEEWPTAQKVTSEVLTNKISQVDQWRQSVQNNQQQHSTTFQSLDTQLTTWLNQITTSIKNAHEASQTVARNIM